MVYTDPSGWLNVGGTRSNDDSYKNMQLSAARNAEWDAIHNQHMEDAGAGGGTFSVWVEGKMLVYAAADLDNFKETGTTNEAMKACADYTASAMTDDDMRESEMNQNDDPNDIMKFQKEGGFLSFKNIDNVIDWMRTNSVNSKIGKRELIVYECRDANGGNSYYAMPWGAQKIFDPACNNSDFSRSLDYLKIIQDLSSDFIIPFLVTGRLHSHNSCTGKINYGVDDLKKDIAIMDFFNTSGNFNNYMVRNTNFGVGKYNPSDPNYNYLKPVYDANNNIIWYEINKFR